MIFQGESRMIFGVQGKDADDLAHELASITFDPKRIKEENYVRRQRLTGHRILELSSWSESQGDSESWNKTYGVNRSTHESTTFGLVRDTHGKGSGTATSEGEGKGGGRNRSVTSGAHQQLVPVHEDFEELANRDFYSFDEQMQLSAQKDRNMRTGSCVLRLVDDPKLYEVDVKRSAAGHLAWDMAQLHRELPDVLEDVNRLKEQNFRSELFQAPDTIEAEMHMRWSAPRDLHRGSRRPSKRRYRPPSHCPHRHKSLPPPTIEVSRPAPTSNPFA